MFLNRRIFKIPRSCMKYLSTTTQRNLKVALLGGAGGFGPSLSLLLKKNPLISCLDIQDINEFVHRVASDVSQINTSTRVRSFFGQMACAIDGAQVVILSQGVQERSHDSKQSLFEHTAWICYDAAKCIAICNPCTIIAVLVPPITMTVPLVSEVMKRFGAYDPRKIFGVTTMELMRASAIVSQVNCCDPCCQFVPVVGGNESGTIVPLLSQSEPPVYFDDECRECILEAINSATDCVTQMQLKGCSAQFSTAFAAARFINSLTKGLSGCSGVREYAFVRCSHLPNHCHYFTCPIQLGVYGASSIEHYGHVDSFEQKSIESACAKLNQEERNVERVLDVMVGKE